MGLIKKYLNITGTALISVTTAAALFGCTTDSSEILVKPVDDALITETVSETEAVTEPEVTEPETVIRTELKTSRTKPSEFQDEKYSALSDWDNCYSIENGYYQISFLEDKLFEEEINSDIRSATDKLREMYTDSYGTKAARSHSSEIIAAEGVVADIICRNGYLSVMLEYGCYPSYTQKQAGAYSILIETKDRIYANHAVTLNYSLTTRNKINSISDLFYEGCDWYSELTSAIYNEYNGNVSYLPDGEPELFTIDYVLVKTGDDDYAIIRYNSSQLNLSCCENMISSHYASMNDISSMAADINYEKYSEISVETCESCQMDFTHTRINESRFYSGSEISLLNEELEKLYDNGFPGRENHQCFALRQPYGTIVHNNPESNIMNINMNIWSACVNGDKLYCHDPYTYESLNVDSLLGTEWRSFAQSDNPEENDFSTLNFECFNSIVYLKSRDLVIAKLTGYSETYQKNITVTVSVPGENANTQYCVR